MGVKLKSLTKGKESTSFSSLTKKEIDITKEKMVIRKLADEEVKSYASSAYVALSWK